MRCSWPAVYVNTMWCLPVPCRQLAAAARRGRFGAARAADNAQRLEEVGAKVCACRLAPATILFVVLDYAEPWPSEGSEFGVIGVNGLCSGVASRKQQKTELGSQVRSATCAGGGDDGAVQGTAGPRRANVNPETHLIKRGRKASAGGRSGAGGTHPLQHGPVFRHPRSAHDSAADLP